MATLQIETFILAPPQLCFDLARDIGLHVRSAGRTQERAVAGRVHGKIEAGEWVTFQGVHFGVRQRFTSRIAEFEPPHFFVDEMVRGAFAAMRHEHRFEPRDNGTLMRDTLIWRAPLGVLGDLADALFLTRHLRAFVLERNAFLKREAETSARAASSDADRLKS